MCQCQQKRILYGHNFGKKVINNQVNLVKKKKFNWLFEKQSNSNNYIWSHWSRLLNTIKQFKFSFLFTNTLLFHIKGCLNLIDWWNKLSYFHQTKSVSNLCLQLQSDQMMFTTFRWSMIESISNWLYWFLDLLLKHSLKGG